MSYCRWSSMNHACDIYLYADVNGGYTCHVAGKKRVSGTPCPPLPNEWWKAPVEQLMADMDKQQRWVENAELVDIGLPHDGESFYCQDRDTMVETLKMLKAEGYTMPEDLIETIQGEDDEEEE